MDRPNKKIKAQHVAHSSKKKDDSESEGMEDAISYYSKEVDDLLGDMSDSDDIQKKKTKAQTLVDEEDDEMVIDLVADHRCIFVLQLTIRSGR